MTLIHWGHMVVYTFIFSKASVFMIFHSWIMPLFLCTSSSYQYLYSSSHWGHHYVLPIVCIDWLPVSDPWSPFVYWDINTSMGMLASSIYMYEIICTSSIFEKWYKSKASAIQMRKLWLFHGSLMFLHCCHHFSLAPMTSVGNTIDFPLTVHIRGKYVNNTKNCPDSFLWSKP